MHPDIEAAAVDRRMTRTWMVNTFVVVDDINFFLEPLSYTENGDSFFVLG